MKSCSGIRADGERCQSIAKTGSEWCPAHDPARAEARKLAASKAAKSKVMPEMTDIKQRLRDVAEGCLEGRIDRGRASVAAQLYGVLIRAIETERRIRADEEIEERLAALEAAASARLSELGGRRVTRG